MNINIMPDYEKIVPVGTSANGNLLRKEQICSFLEISTQTFYRYCKYRNLPAIKIGGETSPCYIDREKFIKWLKNNTVQASHRY